MANEFEIVKSGRISHLNLFINELEYRTSHLHSEFEIIYVAKNPLEVRYPGKEFTIADGEAYIINPNQVHQLEMKEGPSTFICIQFSHTIFKETYPTLQNMRFFPVDIIAQKNGKEIERTLLLLARKWQDLNDSSNLEISALLFHLVFLIVESTPRRLLSPKEKEEEEANLRRITRLLSFIDQNYTHKINLSDFAEQEGLTLSYLSHFAKKVLSEPFQDYVNSLRFNYAKKLLAAGNISLAEAAYESGFSDPRYLSRAFEKYMGINGREYRRKQSGSGSIEEDMRTHISAHSFERYYSRRKSIELIDSILGENA